MRMLALLLAFLIGTPAFAQTEHRVIGADTPNVPVYDVCAGDTLLLRKVMFGDLNKDGTRNVRFKTWIDRANGKAFLLDGANRMALREVVQGKGYIYDLPDAKPCPVVVPPLPQPTKALFGANLSGAEAKDGDAIRPFLDDWKGYIERYGFELIRYPFKLERMTPDRITELQTAIEYARSKGVPVIIDRHDYTWRDVDVMVADWTAFARNFPDDGSVILDLVNEPRGFNDPVVTNDWVQWIKDSKRIIAGLRTNGINHPIALEWPQWSATFRFDKKERSYKACESAACAIDRDAANGPIDPLNRTYMNGHRYWDKGSSGTNKSCDLTWGAKPGLADWAAQLRQRGLKGVLTESAFGSSYGINSTCVEMGKQAIAEIKANGDVLFGVTWWGGGRIWPESYIFKIEPKKAERFTAPVPSYTKMLTGN